MAKSFVFSSESVGEGHPDKVADLISDSVLDACLAQDRTSRVACETMVKSNMVILAGEITTKAKLNYEAIVRAAIREIGYVNADDVFHADSVFINNYLTAQSPDIAQGVDAKKAKGKKTAEQGAGDQGIMFGYACNETPELMPTPIMFAHRLGRELTKIRKSGNVPWLRPDAKSQVSVRYENDTPVEVVNVVISTQHTADVSHSTIEKHLIENVIKKVIPANTLVHGTARAGRLRDRVTASGTWRFVWQDGRELAFNGVALDREYDHDIDGYGITDGSAGLKGRLLATDDLQELKLLASAALSGFARGTQARTQTALGTTITGSVSNGVREGVGDVFDLYAKRTLKDIEENGYFVRVAAGKEFYVYVLESVDPQKASVAGLRPPSPESGPIPPPPATKG